MGTKKGSRPVSKVSSAAAPSQSGATILSANKSSILRSAFSPSEYQLALFASVIQGLDGHHLRIHDVGSGRLQCDHAVNPRESITCLDWGYYGDAKGRDQHQKKKRKRSSGVNGAIVDEGEDVVVAFGTSTSEIRMYSPAEDKITGTLTGGHERGVRDFKFTIQKPGEGWSIGGDGKLVQWDLRKGRSIRVISLPSASASTLARPVPSNPPVLCASQTPYLIDLQKGSETSFSAMRNAVHTLISSSADLANFSEDFIAADSDRYINVFDAQKQKLVGSFVAENEVDSAVLYQATRMGKKETSRTALFQKQLLAALTRDGSIELFSGPFHQFKDQSTSGAITRSNRKSLTRRADAVVKIIRPDKLRTPVPVVSVSFQGPDLVVAWVEGGVSLAFDRIRWQNKDSEDLMLQGEVEIVKARSAPVAGTTNGVKALGKTHVDETHAVVEQGGMDEGLPGAMDIDAASQPSDASDNEEVPSDDEPETKQLTKKPDTDVEMADAQDDTAEPSFGELLRAHGTSGPIDVAAALDEDDAANQAIAPNSKSRHAVATLPSGLSLSTVLTQSLKTNDTTLLESCFHTTDLTIVRSTIQRLDSSLAATLLSKLAERISTRPGRYGHLLVWVQWTCVAHGGAIAGRPEVLREMSSLFKVMDQRSKTLNSLLLLKGKLDMLDAQLGLRQSLRRGLGGGMDSDDEEGVIYVEGEEDLEESDVDVDEEATPAKKAGRSEFLGFDDEEEEDDDEPMRLTMNGMSDNEESDNDNEGLLDNEAEVSADEEDIVSEDEDEDEEDDEEAEGSMLDFIADSEEDEESDLELSTMAPRVGKKGKTKGKAGNAGKR